jgi:hypothetical protein
MFSSASSRSRRGSLLAKTPSGNSATTGSIGSVPLSTFNTGDSKGDVTANSSGAATTADTSTATDSNSGSRIRQSVGSSAAASPAYF